MSNVVNLGKFRKEKAKAAKEAKAAENRRKHGRTKAEKAADRHDAEREAAKHQGHEITSDQDEDKE